MARHMQWDKTDDYFLQRCRQLALIADSQVYPNPKVGSVIVHDGKIIGEGFHSKPGKAHGEVAAVAAVTDKSKLSDASLYVNLEPCNHFGKTPPCTDLILRHKIPRVFIGCLDPNPKVAGRGAQRLRDHGVAVHISPRQQDFKQLNRVFFTNQIHKRTFVVLKWAESSDNFIATFDASGKAIPTPISSSQSLRLAHKLRARHHAIMVGRNTAAIDNPKLNTRLFPGSDPIRIVLDRSLRLSADLNIFQDQQASLILNTQQSKLQGKTRYFVPSQFEDLKQLRQELYQRLGVCSLLVEGGSDLLQQFIDQQAFDEIWRVEAEKTLQKGVSGPLLPKNLVFTQKTLDKEDQLFISQGKELLQILTGS